MNNFIFVLHSLAICAINLIAIKWSKQAIIASIAIYGVLANLFVLKQINLFGLEVTSSDIFVVGISLGLNLIQDKFSKEDAQEAVWISFWGLTTYTILSQFQIWYTPNALDTANQHFIGLLSIAPRLAIASLISYIVSQTIDVNLYAYLKTKLVNRFYFIRNYASIAVSQFIDTILFSLLGLYGLGYNIIHIIIFSYLIKLVAITLSVIVISGSKKVFKL
jgi:uncharacterized integral membrane protein (TIGR00697 family)